MNVQFAVKKEKVYILEVNPRPSRTVPFVCKAVGVPLAKLAALVMTGSKLTELGFHDEIVPKHYSVKEAVFQFIRFRGSDILLSPEMKSTDSQNLLAGFPQPAMRGTRRNQWLGSQHRTSNGRLCSPALGDTDWQCMNSGLRCKSPQIPHHRQIDAWQSAPNPFQNEATTAAPKQIPGLSITLLVMPCARPAPLFRTSHG